MFISNDFVSECKKAPPASRKTFTFEGVGPRALPKTLQKLRRQKLNTFCPQVRPGISIPGHAKTYGSVRLLGSREQISESAPRVLSRVLSEPRLHRPRAKLPPKNGMLSCTRLRVPPVALHVSRYTCRS